MSISELLDTIKSQLDNDPLVSAAVSSVISPEGRTFLTGIVQGLASLEAKHEADKQSAVETAKSEATAAPEQS